MITIVDYGSGNLRSVQKAFERLGAAATITDDPNRVATAERLVLPGVGAFASCMEGLRAIGGDALIEEDAEVVGAVIAREGGERGGEDGGRVRAIGEPGAEGEGKRLAGGSGGMVGEELEAGARAGGEGVRGRDIGAFVEAGGFPDERVA